MYRSYVHICLCCCFAALLLSLIAGCGGGGDKASGGTVTFDVDWPSRMRVLPKAAQCLEVTIFTNGRMVASLVTNRPVGEAASVTPLTFSHIPAGSYGYNVFAYPLANKGGKISGVAYGSLTVTNGGEEHITISTMMDSTVFSLSLTAGLSRTVEVGKTLQLTPTAENSDGYVLLLWPTQFTWHSSNESIATVTDGLVLGTGDGSVDITVTDTETGKQASIKINVIVHGIEATNAPDGATMVWVPSGTFLMGSGYTGSSPQVTLTGYWIYKYEVTVAQYRAFCMATGHALPEFPTGGSWAEKTGWDDPALQQHPIVNVSWFDAKAYADWAGVALPTEAQWEYAARGSEGRNYPWSDGWDEAKCVNHDNLACMRNSTCPVGSFPAGASWCGAQDMAGNVWEWCADWLSFSYDPAPVTDPTGPSTPGYGNERVYRGGSWTSSYGECRCAVRNGAGPDAHGSMSGFRCVSHAVGPL